METTAMPFSDRLRALRTAQSFSQEKLARVADVSTGTVGAWNTPGWTRAGVPSSSWPTPSGQARTTSWTKSRPPREPPPNSRPANPAGGRSRRRPDLPPNE